MSNSIIDQHRDNQFIVWSPFNGRNWVRSFITGNNPPDFFINTDGTNGNIDTLFDEVQSMLGPDNRQVKKV